MTNPELRAEWLVDVKTMADRIITMRTQLQEGLTSAGRTRAFADDFEILTFRHSSFL